MSEDIVVQLRGWSEGSSDDSCRMVWLMRQSADTIEALRGEVDLIKTLGVGAALETVAQKERAQKAEAEAARLKGALEALAGEVESLKQAVEAEKDEQARIEFRLNEVTAERDRLKAALEPFAKLSTDRERQDPPEGTMRVRVVTAPEIEAARKALGDAS